MFSQDSGRLFLGVDMGTSKVAAVLADRDGQVQAAASAAHGCGASAPAGRAEQDAGRLLEAAWRTVGQLPAEQRQRVGAVGVTGQMHGVLLLDAAGRPVSPLFTWQDGRCLEEPGFLDRLGARTGYALRTGFGCATLAWLAAHRAVPAAAVSACTVHDWVVARLCGRPRAVTDPTDAASWGLFDLDSLDWDRRAAEAAGIEPSLLPEVVPCGASAGRLATESARAFGLPAGVSVTAAIGDNQASLLATLRDPERELALTLGTGGQLSAVLAAGAPRPAATVRFEYRPYPGGRRLAVAAALCGGAAWAWLADSVESWARDMGLAAPPRAEVFGRLNALGLAADTAIDVSPVFAGERFDPGLRGAIGGLGVGGLPLGPLARGLARGIVANLRAMLPEELLAGRRVVVGSGNALRRNELLRRMAEDVFGLPLQLPESREEAAAGAAILAAQLGAGRGGET